MNSNKYSLQWQLDRFERLDDNIQYFIQKMAEKYTGAKENDPSSLGSKLMSDSSSDNSVASSQSGASGYSRASTSKKYKAAPKKVWSQLKDTYNKLDGEAGWTYQEELLKKVIAKMKPRKHPREATDPKEKARLFWWWAMEQIKQGKHLRQNMGGVKGLGSSKRALLMELTDSEDEVEKQDKMKKITDTIKLNKRGGKEKNDFKERVQRAMQNKIE